jgi:aromatic-L-amino-acid/L-tryptophan decarboxylase
VANLIGLTVARNQRAGYDLRQDGVAAAEKPMVLYASSQIHSSVIKAVELLGLGRNALREIAVDENYAIDLQALQEAVTRDRQAGFHPFCVVGAAGTTNTGAFDDLNALADLCQAENLWFHVDGAFGAFAALAPSVKHLAKGMTRADSLAFDLHKWFYLPFEVGCVLVRSETDHRHAFSLSADYLVHTSRGPAGGAVWPSDYGIQLSRGFRALKVWMAFKAHGTALIGRLVEQNVQQSRQLAALVQADPKLELMAPVPLNVVNFRYKAGGLTGKTLNAFNEELLLRLQESGVAVPSYTTLNGAYVLRACITNHRTRREDLTLVVQKVLELGQTLENEGFGHH